MGQLYVQHIKPLLPMKFLAALWDQGERDEVTSMSNQQSSLIMGAMSHQDLTIAEDD